MVARAVRASPLLRTLATDAACQAEAWPPRSSRSGNGIGAEGASSLSGALADLTALKGLDLWYGLLLD